MSFFNSLKKIIGGDKSKLSSDNMDDKSFLNDLQNDVANAVASMPTTPNEKYETALKCAGYENLPGGAKGDIRKAADRNNLDIITAIKYAKDAFSQGILDAAPLLYEIYSELAEVQNKNYDKERLFYIQSAAERGHCPSMRYMINVYFDGKFGVTRNLKKVEEYAQKQLSDKSGNAYYFYATVCNLKNEHQKAFDAISKALEAGVPNAYLFMGIIYCYGKGIAQDLEKGKACLKKAVELRVIEAYSVMGDVLALIEENKNEALKYWEKGARLGSGICSYNVGMNIIHTDFSKGVEWLRKAYEKNIKRWNVVSTDPLAPLYTYVCRIGTEKFEVESQNSNKPEVEEITEAYVVKFGKGLSQEQFNQINYSKK